LHCTDCARGTVGKRAAGNRLSASIYGDSGCEFNRNGTWHDAKAAREHVRFKYEFLLAQDRINATEDFIEQAATKSSILFGQPYTVRCDGDPPVLSSLWLSRELARYRAIQP